MISHKLHTYTIQYKCEIRKKKFEIRKFILKASINYLSEISYIYENVRGATIYLLKSASLCNAFWIFLCFFLCVCYINENEVPQVFHILLIYVTQSLCCIWENGKKENLQRRKYGVLKQSFVIFLFSNFFFPFS